MAATSGFFRKDMPMDYTKQFEIAAPPDVVNDALRTKIPQWWSRQYSGAAARVGEEFTVRFDGTFKTLRVTEASENKTCWFFVDTYIDADSLTRRDELKGSTVEWSVAPRGDATEVTIVHKGLSPQVECYALCAPGWDYFGESLKALAETGNGNPWLGHTGKSSG